MAGRLAVVAAAAAAVVTGLASGCAAPPLGFGAGPRMASPAGEGTVEGRTAVGVGDGRQTYQAEVSSMFRPRRWFAAELGLVLTRTIQDDDDGGEVTLNGGFPFVRPRFHVGGASLAIGLSGMGAGGGGGGFIGGIADAQLGYGTGDWGVYAGAYRHYFELVAEDAVLASSRQLRAGGQYAFAAGASRVGVALELHHQRDTLTNDPFSQTSRFWGGALKLSFTSPSFR